MTGDATAEPKPWLRWIGGGLGLGLAVAAVLMVVREHETITEALQAVRHPAPAPALLLCGAVAANVVLTALMFSVLISRYGRVGRLEMQALVAAATLVNFLPLRPGLFGRVAYHKAFNAIPAVATFKTVVQAVVISVSVAGFVAAALVVSRVAGWPLWVVAGLPLPLLAAGCVVGDARIWAGATLLRYLEVMVWAVRYHAAFSLLGLPIDAPTALAFSCCSIVTMLVPFFGNGLGLREWAIGLAAPLLTAYELELGLAAELVNRAAELLVVAALGLSGIAWLAWRRRGGGAML